MNRQISRGVMLSVIAQATALMVNLVYTPLMIRILGQSEYGLYQLVQSVVNYLNLMNFGFSGAYISFYSREKARGSEAGIARLNGMFLRVFLFIALLCVIAGAAMIKNIHLLGDRLTEADYATARTLMILLVANLAVSFPNMAFTVYIAANERFVFKQSVTILLNVLIPLFSLPLLYPGAETGMLLEMMERGMRDADGGRITGF